MPDPVVLEDVDHPNRPLPPGVAGDHVRVRAQRLVLGAGATIGDRSTVVGDEVTLGAGVIIGPDSDLRAGTLSLGDRSEVAARVSVLVADIFRVGEAARLSSGVRLVCRRFEAGNLLYLGDDTVVGMGGTTESTAEVRLGNRVALGPRNTLNANCRIDLADDVGSGCDVAFWTHGFHFGHRVLEGFDPVFEPIQIERNVWFGFRCAVMPGVSIGENTIVASGAVVSRDLPADCLAGGIPAVTKKVLERQSLAPDVAIERVAPLLARWVVELEWKGLRCQEATGEAVWSVVVGADPAIGPAHRVVLVPGPLVPPPSAVHDGIEIVVAIDDLSAAPRPTDVHFELRSARVSGPLSMLAHDLRDHLRRHTLPCGEHETFRSIDPEPFRRLRTAFAEPGGRVP